MSSRMFGTATSDFSGMSDDSMALHSELQRRSELQGSYTNSTEAATDGIIATFSQLQESGAVHVNSQPTMDMVQDGNLMYKYLQRPFEHEYDLMKLKLHNRSIDSRRELTYPRDLLMAMVKSQSRMRAVIVPKADCSTLSVPVPYCRNSFTCVEENNQIEPFVNHLGTTMELGLCNELALAKFRDAVSKHFPELTKGLQPWEMEALWKEAKGDIRGVCPLAYWVEDDGITLSAWMPGTYHQMSVRVAARRIAPGQYNISANGDLPMTLALR